MTQPPSVPQERYLLEGERYVLYVGRTRALSTETVALLVDTRLRRLVTHGDPPSVRRELDEMRAVLRVSPLRGCEHDWLLLEGRPNLCWLNRALSSPDTLDGLGQAFACPGTTSAIDITRDLLVRVAQRSS